MTELDCLGIIQYEGAFYAHQRRSQLGTIYVYCKRAHLSSHHASIGLCNNLLHCMVRD